MWPDRVSNPGPLTYKSGTLPTALHGPALVKEGLYIAQLWSEFTMIVLSILIVSSNNSDSYDNYWSCFETKLFWFGFTTTIFLWFEDRVFFPS